MIINTIDQVIGEFNYSQSSIFEHHLLKISQGSDTSKFTRQQNDTGNGGRYSRKASNQNCTNFTNSTNAPIYGQIIFSLVTS